MTHSRSLVYLTILVYCCAVESTSMTSQLADIAVMDPNKSLLLNTTATPELKRLSVHIFEEEPIGREVASLNFLVDGLSSKPWAAKSTKNFQIFNSDPQSGFFDLSPTTGILRIARRIDRDNLCPTFQSCCFKMRDEYPSWRSIPMDTEWHPGDTHMDHSSGLVSDSALTTCRLDLNVRSNDQYSKIILVHVYIKDVNDNPPIWLLSDGNSDRVSSMQTTPSVTVQVSEGSLIGDSFNLPTASDADNGENGVVRYVLYPEVPEFGLNWSAGANFSSGDSIYSVKWNISSNVTSTFGDSFFPSLRHELRLLVRLKLDREKYSAYNRTIIAIDGGTPSRSSSIKLSILITDVNDNSPQFLQDTYMVELLENSRIHTPVVQVSAVDVDEGVNSIIKYRFSSLTKMEYIRLFTVDSVTGWIHVKWTIDYELHKKVHLTIEAADEGHPSRVSMCVVEIHVLDENDHSPEIKFEPAYLTNYALVPENEKPGRAVAVFSVSDHDSGVNGNVTCKLIGSPEPFSNTKREQGDESSEDISTSLFKLESMNVPFSLIYKLVTASSFDRERTSKIIVWILCSDQGTPSKNVSASLTVRIMDDNDERPKFTKAAFHHNVPEDISVGSPMMQITATDKDEGDNAKLIYRLTGQDADYLVVDENTGQINLRRALDYETKNALHFRIHVSDRGRPPMDDSAAAIISVIDVNDNPPDLPGRIEFAVFENHTASVPLGKLNASDRDSGRNAEVTFALLSCTTYPLSGIAHNEVITIPYGSSSYSKASSSFFVAEDGHIYLGLVKLDRETYPLYELVVKAEDHGTNQLSVTSVVIIHVLDINDNAPRFVFPSARNDTVYLWKDTKPGEVVSQVRAIDDDLMENGLVTYRMKVGQPFEITKLFNLDEMSGKLYLRLPVEELVQDTQATSNGSKTKLAKTELLPSEWEGGGFYKNENSQLSQQSVFTLIIIATDGGSPKLTSSAALRIFLNPPFNPPPAFSGPNEGNGGYAGPQTPGDIKSIDVNEKQEMGWSSVHGIADNLTNLGLFLCMVVAITFFVCIILLFIATALRHSRATVYELTTSGQPTLGSAERRPPSYRHTKLMRQLKDTQTQIQSNVEYGRTKRDEDQYATLPLGVTVNSDSVLFTVNSV